MSYQKSYQKYSSLSQLSGDACWCLSLINWHAARVPVLHIGNEKTKRDKFVPQAHMSRLDRVLLAVVLRVRTTHASTVEGLK